MSSTKWLGPTAPLLSGGKASESVPSVEPVKFCPIVTERAQETRVGTHRHRPTAQIVTDRSIPLDPSSQFSPLPAGAIASSFFLISQTRPVKIPGAAARAAIVGNLSALR